MTTSLLLDRATNDLCLDAAGNLAICTDPYRILQDVACACSVFKGECWYDTTLGLPYKASILGYSPPLAYLKQQYVEAALTVPGVASAVCFFTTARSDRELTGQIQVTTTSGLVGALSIQSGGVVQPLFAVTDDGSIGQTSDGQAIVAT